MTTPVPAQISGDGATVGDVITWDASGMAVWDASAGGAPSGAAGGVLSGTYPNPGFAADMATQAELDAHTADTTDAHDASAISFSPTGTIAATDVQAAIAEVASEAAGGYTDEQARDAMAAMFAAGTHTGISFTNNDGADSMSATVSGGSGSRYKEVSLAGANDLDFLGSDIAAGSTLETSWSWLDQGSLTYARKGGRGHIVSPTETHTYIRGIYRSIPVGMARMTVLMEFTGQASDIGLVLRNSANGKLITLGARNAALVYNYWNSTTSWQGTTVNGTSNLRQGALAFSINVNSTTSYDFRYGPSYHAQTAWVSALNPQTQLGAAPDQIGIAINNENGGPKAISIEYVKFE